MTLELGQLVQAAPGRSELVPWVFDLEDRRFNVQMRRRLMLALFAAEGAGIGASLGAQAGPSNPAYLGLGAGVGLLTGIGYASLMPGARPAWNPATHSRSPSARCRIGPSRRRRRSRFTLRRTRRSATKEHGR